VKGLRSILGDSVKQAGGARRAEEQACLELWPVVVGEGIAEATRAERFRDGILFVITRSSVWTQELTFFKEEAVRALNERLGRPLVRDIRFKVGPLTSQRLDSELEERPSEESPAAGLPSIMPETMLTERSRAQVERALEAIKNEQLRERTRQVLVREAHRREQKERQGWKECPRCGTLHPATQRLCPLCRLHIRT
jgi:hypothetical protein